MFAAIARFAYRKKWLVLTVYAVVAIGAAIFGSSVIHTLKPSGYDDPSSQSYRAAKQLLQRFQIGNADIVPLYSVASGTVQDDANRTAITAVLDRVAQDPSVIRVLSFYNTGAAPFVSPDQRRTFATISLRGDDKQKIETLDRLRPFLKAEGGVQTQIG